MAAGKTDLRGSQGFLEALAIPRPASRILLWIVCLGICQAAWYLLDLKLLAFASGQAMAICTMCLAAVWGFREKTADILGSNELNSEDLRMVQLAAKQLGTRSIRRALWVGICFLLVGSTAVSSQLAGFVMQWMVLLGGFGLAEALYAFWLTSYLSLQLREWRDLKKIKIREGVELQTQLDRFHNSVAMPGEETIKDVPADVIAGTLIPVE